MSDDLDARRQTPIAEAGWYVQMSGIELGAMLDGFSAPKSKPFRRHLPSTLWQVKHSGRTSLTDLAKAAVLSARIPTPSYPMWYKRYR
jgi:hypothetical protein